MTWSRGRDLDYFWPQVFLPKEPEICDARISTFGYNSSVFKGSGRTTVSILDFAKGLLFDLKYAIDVDGKTMDVGTKPIIFVVHSMGGLIVKMVCKSMKEEMSFQD
jgi:predicted alpha/beta hydrolase